MTLGELDDVSKPDPDHGEQRVSFFGDHELEGKLGWPGVPLDGVRSQPVREIRGGVVVAHPYPPNGGNMDLPLMYRIAKECRRHRFASLRFNFRSVGASSGSFSGTEEDRDVAAAVEFMAGQLATAGEQTGAILPQGLAGWSFGSVMAARAAAELAEVQALALVGFPIHWEQLPADTLERLAGYRGSVLAVCAENDHHGTPDEVERELSGLGLNLKIEVVRDADHYLMGSEQKVGRLVADFFDVALGR